MPPYNGDTMKKHLCGIITTTLLILGCSPTITTPGVSNEGFIPVASSNAYSGANVFLGKEMAEAPILKNFLVKRGAPTAIKVTDKIGAPTELSLFYLPERETFIASRFRSGENTFDWIIRGPYAMSRKEFLALSGLVNPNAHEAHFIVEGDDLTLALRQPIKTKFPAIKPEVPPALENKPKDLVKAKIVPLLTDEERTLLPPHKFITWNSDQRAVYVAKGFSDRAENGDLRHTVVANDETTKKLAEWYTGAEKNATQIAQINSLRSDQYLTVGSIVVIPGKLLVRALKMPAGY
jgi:hypothetical protein